MGIEPIKAIMYSKVLDEIIGVVDDNKVYKKKGLVIYNQNEIKLLKKLKLSDEQLNIVHYTKKIFGREIRKGGEYDIKRG